jgi:uncharacterized membrane protein
VVLRPLEVLPVQPVQILFFLLLHLTAVVLGVVVVVLILLAVAVALVVVVNIVLVLEDQEIHHQHLQAKVITEKLHLRALVVVGAVLVRQVELMVVDTVVMEQHPLYQALL